MNYFEYNALKVHTLTRSEPRYEELVFTGDEVIEVDEDHTVTVDDVRAYIRNMHDGQADDEDGLESLRISASRAA
ncbi:MAG: hypothetical protein AAFX56_00430 [Pseudomonadota bacterium]